MQKTPLNDSVNEIKTFQENIKKTAEQSEDVKAGKCTTEEELQEPAYVLYNQIAESSIKILQLPEVINTFSLLSEKFGDDTSKAIVELMAIAMTQSAHQAVLFYDDLLKAELTKQFDNIGEHLNMALADIAGHSGALSVFKSQLSDIQKKLQIDKFTKDNNVTPTTE